MSEFASTSSGNPLLAALSAEQVALLVTIARPVIAAQYSGGTSTWPAWAYVAEQFEDENPGSDALVVWRSLPTVPGLNDGIIGVPGRRPYGLVWRGDNHTIDPTYEERLGLSIAGFYQLQRHNRAPLVAEALLLVLSALAEWEAKTVRADVTGPGTKDVALDEYTSWFSTAHREKPYVIMTEVVGQCLRYEYFLIWMLENQSGWSVRLGGRRLRPYLDLGGDVERYLDRIASDSTPQADGAAMNPSSRPTVFIGHGRDREWLVLQNFLEKKLDLQVVEFNSVATAGVATAVRLQTMLEQSHFALLVMTGENDQADGTRHARENVVHEIGLFQGRLGFSRAIVMLEDGCEEFSNIHGLGQIRFPKDNISAVFEDIRDILDREGLLPA